jgi:glycosyltransferase involved in cell wall biosynthesis
MSISVVIPSYNCGRFLNEAIESALAQTLPPTEIVVIDDGSTDDTRDRVDRYAGQVRYIHQENQGVSAARNTGIRHAACDLVAFLDADDVWHPRKLEIQVPVLEGEPELGFVGAREYDWPADNHPTLPDRMPVIQRIPWRDLVVKNYFATSALLVRREVLERAGPFDVTLQGPEDYDMWLRMAEIAPGANLDFPLSGYREVPGSISKHTVRMQNGMRRILRKLDGRNAWKGDWRLRRKAYSYCDYSCAYMFGAAGCHGRALGNAVRSLAGYPWPYRRDEVRMSLARLRLAGVSLGRLLKTRWRHAEVVVESPTSHDEPCLTGAAVTRS